MKNKEQIHDAKIAPLMEQIIKTCQKHKIGMIATFAIPTPEDAGLYCSTRLADEDGHVPGFIEPPSSPLMITSIHKDGSKTITAVLG